MDSNIDTAPLLAEDDQRWRRKTGITCILITLLGACALAVAVIITYFLQFKNGILGKPLKVMALNTWGMPHEWSEDKEVRMVAIGEYIQKRDYDVYLLEELWMRPDHATIQSLVPQGEDYPVESPSFAGEGAVRWIKNVGDFVLTGEAVCQVEGAKNISIPSPTDGILKSRIVAEGDTVTPYTPIFSLTVGKYFMTEVGDLAKSICDGRVLVTSCSGLAVVSKFPLKAIQFKEYTWKGNEFKIPPDGEYWAGKGIGRVRIEPYVNITLDIFVTHTCALDDNSYYREKQVSELVTHIEGSDADFVILGGDFNVDPRMNETSYPSLKKVMVNSIEEFFHIIAEWLNPKRATYGNPANTYSYTYSPVMYDYIFHKGRGKNMIWTDFFQVPFLKKWIGRDKSSSVTSGKNISFSDHEAVTSHLRLYKYDPQIK